MAGMNRVIHYAIHKDEGTIISRVGSEVAWPVLDYAAIGTDGDFTQPFRYDLETMPVLSIGHEWGRLRWTKKIPIAIKNLHRAYWGFPALKVTRRVA